MDKFIIVMQAAGEKTITQYDKIIVALQIMGKGMLGIFIALSIVYLFVILLNKLFPEKKQEVPKDEGLEG